MNLFVRENPTSFSKLAKTILLFSASGSRLLSYTRLQNALHKMCEQIEQHFWIRRIILVGKQLSELFGKFCKCFRPTSCTLLCLEHVRNHPAHPNGAGQFRKEECRNLHEFFETVFELCEQIWLRFRNQRKNLIGAQPSKLLQKFWMCHRGISRTLSFLERACDYPLQPTEFWRFVYPGLNGSDLRIPFCRCKIQQINSKFMRRNHPAHPNGAG